MKKLFLVIMLLIAVGCGKNGGGSNPNPNPPVEPQPIEYTLQTVYDTIQDGNNLSYGDLVNGEFGEIVVRIAEVNGQACWTKSVLYKQSNLNHYYLQVYGTNEFAANVEVCAELEGNYFVELTSDYDAEFTKSEN